MAQKTFCYNLVNTIDCSTQCIQKFKISASKVFGQIYILVSNFLNYNYTCRAANEKWGDSIREYQCVDVSQDMISVAQYLLKGINHYFLWTEMEGHEWSDHFETC